MKKLFLTLFTMMLLYVPTFAMEQGGYEVDCNINYYNPDTNEIEDGGSANAALGEGMCRSATATTALVEFDGTDYYVTIRLLLQSNTKDVMFWRHIGYNTYEEVTYEIMIEDAGTDSIDYRFRVDDPFAPIKASMYVTPMGRATVWFIELDASSLSADTGDFVVSVSTVVVEEAPPVVEELSQVEDVVVEEVPEITDEPTEEPLVEGGVLDAPSPSEEEPVVDEPVEEPAADEPTVGSDALVAPSPDAVSQSSTNYTPFILFAIVATVAWIAFMVKLEKKQ